MITEGLQEHAPGEPIDPHCLDIERRRHHALRLDSSNWGQYRVIGWEDEAWPFLVVDYLRHVQACGNPFHLDPVIVHDFTTPDVSKRTVLTFQLQRASKVN